MTPSSVSRAHAEQRRLVGGYVMLRLAFRPAAPLLGAARRFRLGHRVSDTRSAFATAASSSRNPDSIHEDADEKFMALALREATRAASADEVPVGAVLVCNGTGVVLSKHSNSTLREEDPTAHAELKCIREGAKKLGSWRLLQGTTLYVTLEPCPMCAGGILNARLGAVVWGAPNPLIGADGSWIELMGDGGNRVGDTDGDGDVDGEGKNETREVEQKVEGEENKETNKVDRRSTSGGPVRPHAFKPTLIVRRRVLEKQCGEVMRNFFRRRREERKEEKECALRREGEVVCE